MAYKKIANKSQNHCGDPKINSIRDIPSYYCIKNADSIFVDMSEITASLLGWEKACFSVGKTEYDVPCETAKFAEIHIQVDREVIQRNQKSAYINIGNYKTGWAVLLGEKIPIKLSNSGETGIFVNSIDITESCSWLLNLHLADSKILNSTKSFPYYVLTVNQMSPQLTERQRECLFLLIRGKTAKQIANILNISLRTVEEHIANIKQSFNCYNKSQLIEKAIDSGFLYFIPKEFIKIPMIFKDLAD